MKHPTIDTRSDNLSEWIAYGTEMNNYAAELQRRVRELEAKIDEHNRDCESQCDARKNCEAWTDRGRTCPDCPKDYLIEKGDQQ